MKIKSLIIYFPGGPQLFLKKGLEVGKEGTEEKTTIKSFAIKGASVMVTYANKEKIEYKGFPISIEY
jgi:hypothetical protein